MNSSKSLGHSGTLPFDLTSFVGREQEVAEVRRLLATTRLLTLTGVGGVGKTRLAYRVAAGLVAAYADGVWLVELAPLTEPDLVSQAVATAIGIAEQPGRTVLEILVDALRPRALLLLLDNCEHLIEASAQMTEALLRTCPRLQILATSREALNIPGEVAWLVPSLSVPSRERSRLVPAPRSLEACDAVRLFVERAASVRPAFRLSDANAASVAEICRRLDGIPLALELAAARVNILSVEQIAQRLDDRFHLLTTGRRTLVSRHQTLRSLVDWSHELLSAAEQALFRRLSVFAGGWTLEAAQAVGGWEGIEPTGVLDLLASLVDKSLVLSEDHGDRLRYRMLETLRQYGSEKLQDAGEQDRTRLRHLQWFLELAERTQTLMTSPEQRAALDCLGTELDNFRVAVEWCMEKVGAIEEGLRLAAALAQFSWRRGHATEWRQRLSTLLAVAPSSEGSKRADALLEARAGALEAAGFLSERQGDLAAGRASLEASLALWRQLGAGRRLIPALAAWGRLETRAGNTAVARGLLEEGLALAQEFEEKIGFYRALYYLGEIDEAEGNDDRATALFEESLALEREQGDDFFAALALRNLTAIALRRGEFVAARAWLTESLVLGRDLGGTANFTPVLELFAALAASELQPARALRLAGAAAAARHSLGMVPTPREAAQIEVSLKAAREALGEAATEAAWAEGAAMAVEEAVAYALAVDTPAAELEPDLASQIDPLTPREREVAVLVARGLTNRQIAADLVIAEGTAGIHLDHIFTKLALHSRAQVAAWAVEHGLISPASLSNAQHATLRNNRPSK